MIDIDNNFTSHLLDKTQEERCVLIRRKTHELADFILDVTPKGREQSVALTKLEEVMFWANAGIARYDPSKHEDEP